jgi:ACS family hexuronate transporter-like MFS transporter
LRIGLGIAEAPSFPGALQTVERAMPPHARARAVGILFTGSSVGAMIAPPLATWLNHRWGWRFAFIGTALVGLSWVPIWLAVSFRPSSRAVLDRPPAAPAPHLPVESGWSLLGHAAVLRSVLVVLASAPAISFSLLWGAKYLVAEHHLTQDDVGRYLWLPPLLFDVGAVLFGDVASRRVRRLAADQSDRLLVTLACALAASLVAMPFARGPWAAISCAALSMAGGAGLYAIATSDMIARVPAHRTSLAGGVTAAAQSLAHVVVNPAVGALVQKLGGYRFVLIFLGLWNLPGCLAFILWRPPPRRDA